MPMLPTSPRLALASLAVAALLAAGQARAATVDFESVASDCLGLGGLTSVSHGGFAFTDPGAGISVCDSFSEFFSSNGSDYIAGTSITMMEAMGAAFDLIGFDVAEFASGGPFGGAVAPIVISVEGMLAAGGTVSAMFTTDGIADGTNGPGPDFQAFGGDLSAFRGLSKVIFSANTAFGIDNLQVAVPAPAALPLLAAGVLALAAIRRRRRA